MAYEGLLASSSLAANRASRDRSSLLSERQRMTQIVNAALDRKLAKRNAKRAASQSGGGGGAALGAGIGAAAGLIAAPFTGGATLLPGLFTSLPALTAATAPITFGLAGAGAAIGGAIGAGVSGGGGGGGYSTAAAPSQWANLADLFPDQTSGMTRDQWVGLGAAAQQQGVRPAQNLPSLQW